MIERYEPRAAARAAVVFDWLARYHRLEVRGLGRIPAGAALLVGNHGGGLGPTDGLFLVEYYRRFGFDDPVFVLAHDLLFRLGGLGRQLARVGIVPASRDVASEILTQGRKLLVYPGGDLENMRSFFRRREVVLAGRTGFVEMAIAGGVPIVPVVTAGSHETLIVLWQGRRLARLLRLDRSVRLRSLPVALTFPWGALAGPAMALPHFPLPAKVTVEIGEPIRPSFWQDLPAEDRVREVYRLVEVRMQSLLDHLYAERRYPILG